MAEPLSFENHIKLISGIYNTDLITLRAKLILVCKSNDIVAQTMFKCLVESSNDEYSVLAARLASEGNEDSDSDAESVTDEESKTEHGSDFLRHRGSDGGGGQPRRTLDHGEMLDLTQDEPDEEESTTERSDDDTTDESDASVPKEVKSDATKRRRGVSNHEEESSHSKRDKRDKRVKETYQPDRNHQLSHALCGKCGSVFFPYDNKEGDCFHHFGDLVLPEDDNGDHWIDHDERCHGTIDSDEMRLEHPEAFEWDCCDKDGLSAPCEAGKHESGGSKLHYAILKFRGLGT